MNVKLIPQVHNRMSLMAKCAHCDMTFTNHTAKRRHVNTVHFPHRFACPICGQGRIRRTAHSHAGVRSLP